VNQSSYRLGLMHGALLVALVLAIFVIAHAETWAVMSGIAVHLDGRSHCNWRTDGLGVEYSNDGADRTQLGFYRNSNCKWSAYAARAWLPLKFLDLRGGAIVGAVTGYSASVTPVAALALSYEHKDWGVNVIGIPPTGESGGGVLWLQFKKKW
jgi:hypothetical protein